MAKDKKSFIAYTDWKDTFDALPDDKAGKLIKFIYAYVNDENPQTDDILINAVFANIKNTLKRDLKKWEKQHGQRSEAGKRSAEVRKRNATLVNARSISSTVSDSVSVSVNDSVNDNDIEKRKVKEKSEIIYPFDSKHFMSRWDLWKQYKSTEHKFKYKSEISEQSALKKLSNLANGNEQSAIDILDDAMANGYKGFFEIKTNIQTNTNGQKTQQSARNYIDKIISESN